MRKCQQISAEDRTFIFNGFWSMRNWDERQVYVSALVSKELIKKKTTDKETSRRSSSLNYFLKVQSGECLQVCKQMFIQTLSMNDKTINNWVNDLPVPSVQRPVKKPRTPNAGISSPIAVADRTFLLQWLTGLPVVPSHYCRQRDSYKNKKFLLPNTKIVNLYEEYKSTTCELGYRSVGITVFSQTFHAENFSVFIPRNDRCDVCVAAEQGNSKDDEYQVHLNEKNLARAEKSKDKSETTFMKSVWTMDLQAVLTCPKTKAGSLYYKTKLQVHNMTFYNLQTHEGFCYLWDESEGDLSSETFAWIQYHHFASYLTKNRSIKEVVVWSDGCGYQNRNIAVSNAYLQLAIEYDVSIEQKYLVSGHSQMECDSMHSVIERKLNVDIYAPSDYRVIMQLARKSPAPYDVICLTHSDFRKLSGKYYLTIRPGKKPGDKTVFNLRGLRYEKLGGLFFKTSFEDGTQWVILPQRLDVNLVRTGLQWDRMHEDRLPIKERKFKDLQSMKNVLPGHVHSFYDSIPFRKSE
jgi:hypothetical protein